MSDANISSRSYTEPWGVVTHRGRWYLVGHDRDRDDTRTFRLSRIDADNAALAEAAKAQGPKGEAEVKDAEKALAEVEREMGFTQAAVPAAMPAGLAA